MAESSTGGAATGGVRLLLRLEGFALFAAAIGAYVTLDGRWWLLAILILAPDLAFLGYLAGNRLGAAAYNAAHSTIGPLALGCVALAAHWPTVLSIALIWAAHVGIDRALGYGLKYADGFGNTHLGRIGRQALS
ncbi:MAG: DUF4260 domain-containing protein [Rhizobiales bacterium]|nr:DUF4260 domain-containing protein [Hyphomicrobiales bacterium]MBN9008830.1 DUF4260 domain-containing protein [Hyphomicrobiales bacterium]